MEMSRLTRDGTVEPGSRDQFSGTHGNRGILVFPVQLTTSRIGNLTRLIHTLLCVMTIHICVATHTHYMDLRFREFRKIRGPDLDFFNFTTWDLYYGMRVNTGVLSFLDYVDEDISLVALSDPPQTLNPNTLPYTSLFPLFIL